MASVGILIISLLVGQIFHATVNRIAKVEDDYHWMMELKKRAEAADVAKSQVCDVFTLLGYGPIILSTNVV